MVNPLSILISKSEYNTFITFITKCFYKDLSARVGNHLVYNCPTHHKNPNHCRSMINISTEQLFKICTGFPKDIFTILMDENVLRTNTTETGTLMYERKSTSSKINDESTWYNVQINHTVSFPMTSVPHRMRYQCCKLYLGQVKICAR